ncbi:hypothetical protein ACFWFF_28480, partial [Streptomyces sp. NPDC060223]
MATVLTWCFGVARAASAASAAVPLLSGLSLTAVASGTSLAQAATGKSELSPDLLPDPAATPVPNPPSPKHLTREERTHQGPGFSTSQWIALPRKLNAFIKCP